MITPEWITPDWPAPATVRAIATTRAGGASAGVYARGNLGTHVGDDSRTVMANRTALASALNLPGEPAWLDQVHGARCVRLDGETVLDPADAAMTDSPGQVCAVLTADCLPVLLCDAQGRRVAAAHAGWRGLAAGVLEATLAMLDVAPADILVWFGPAIAQQAFEVGEEVRAAFVDQAAEDALAFTANAHGRWQADLYGLARQRLARAGVTQVYGGEHCTYGEKERFFSYRRDGQCGRMASLIWLVPAQSL